ILEENQFSQRTAINENFEMNQQSASSDEKVNILPERNSINQSLVYGQNETRSEIKNLTNPQAPQVLTYDLEATRRKKQNIEHQFAYKSLHALDSMRQGANVFVSTTQGGGKTFSHESLKEKTARLLQESIAKRTGLKAGAGIELLKSDVREKVYQTTRFSSGQARTQLSQIAQAHR